MKNTLQEKSWIARFSRGILGLFSLKLIILSSIFFLNSCQEENLDKSIENQLRSEFVKSIGLSQDRLANVEVFSRNKSDQRMNYSREVELETIYLDFPHNPDLSNELSEIQSLRGIADAIDSYSGTVTYEETGSGISFNVPIETVVNGLSPSLSEAKNYLYAKGFNDAEISQMIAEHGGQEIDLIPFVMSMVSIEQDALSWNPSSSLFVNQVYAADVTWQDYVRCAMIGIGADVLWALGTSNASSWSKKAMRKAFGTVAKRFLGPIGVGIAVVTFGVCIGEAYLS